MTKPLLLSAAMKYSHLALIKFTGRFPIDMLRYDRCMPYREADSALIQHSIENCSGGQVIVLKYSEMKDWANLWTMARWKTYGSCELRPLNMYDPTPDALTKEELDAQKKAQPSA